MQGYKSVIETSALSDTNMKVSEVIDNNLVLFKAYEGLINDINSKSDQSINLYFLRTPKITEYELIAIHYYIMNRKAHDKKRSLEGILDQVRSDTVPYIQSIIKEYGKTVAPIPSSGESASAAASAGEKNSPLYHQV